MPLLEGKTPTERRQVYILIALVSVASLGIIYNFVLSGSTKKKGGKRPEVTQGSPKPTTTPLTPEQIRSNQIPTPIVYRRPDYADAMPGRNIFAYYVAPTGTTSGVAITSGSPVTETPTGATEPTPVPPSIVLAGVAPGSVYARTSDFAMQLSGDKFTPETRVYIDGSELPTEFVSNQSLRVQVPASVISSEGARAIIVRTPDGALFSNPLSLNIMPAPPPPFTYVGLIGRKPNNDTAVLKERNGGELRNVRRDEIVGRFRVTNISEQQVELTDTELKIKHTLAFADGRTSSNPVGLRPTTSPPRPPRQQPDEDTLDDDN